MKGINSKRYIFNLVIKELFAIYIKIMQNISIRPTYNWEAYVLRRSSRRWTKTPLCRPSCMHTAHT